MADTRMQLEVEDWVRREWMPGKFGQPFFRERVRLSPGGVFMLTHPARIHLQARG
jgi:hypothetical protein